MDCDRRYHLARSWRRAIGFSMIESLIAIAVFALGFVAVAALFPVGATLQKEAAGDLVTQQVARNVKALLKSRKFSHLDLTNNAHPRSVRDTREVQPVLKQRSPGNLLDPPGRLPAPVNFERWMLNDRSYFLVRNNLGANAYHPRHAAELGDPYADEFKRAFYWVPMIRSTKNSPGPLDWQVFVFILRRDDVTYDRLSFPIRSTTNPFSTIWANWDGFRSPSWYVPGVRSLAARVHSTNRRQFNLTNSWTGINPGNGLEIVAGDLILDSNGVRHTVVTAGTGSITVDGDIPLIPTPPNKLWYGRPAAAGRPSPTRQILILTDVVE